MNFPIVGIGASAGGLEALIKFFESLPPDTGMGFVVVTHQHPGHTSLLPQLLGKQTSIPVVEAQDGVHVEPNCVYLSRPGDYLVIQNGALKHIEFEEQGGLRLPIDYFFRSLADDRDENAIGIVLSGTGTDGTLGLKAIKGGAGMATAQEPASAGYPAMPASTIATGVVDYVLRSEEMPKQLVAYAKGTRIFSRGSETPGDESLPESMRGMLALLRKRCRNDFSAYKPSTIRRRIERRMNVHQIGTLQGYLHYLQDQPHELDLLFKELLIGATSFFRDPAAFDALAHQILGLRRLLKARPDDSPIRVWVPACSTGEEAFSIAIMLAE